MRRAVVIAVLTLTLPCALSAQSRSAEEEVRAFVLEYDKAIASRNIASLERVIPHDYVFTGANGRKSDRAQVLRYFTQQRDKPSYNMVSRKHENVVVRAVGDMAVVTNDYTSRTTPINAPAAEPDSNSGRHTGVFEKRNGQWFVIAEQDTEQAHDDKLMQRQVTKAGRDYNELVRRVGVGDLADIKRMLSDEYTGTSIDGDVRNKAQEIEFLEARRAKIGTSELLEQKVFAIDNSTAMETGKVRVVGTEGGKRIDITTRFTRTWVSWGDGWQIIAQHASRSKR